MRNDENIFETLDVSYNGKPKGDVNVGFFGRDCDPYARYLRNENSSSSSKVRNFIIAEASHLPFRDKSFDAVFSWHVIDYAKDPFQFFRELCRVANRKVILRYHHRKGSGALIPGRASFLDEKWLEKASDAVSLPNEQFTTVFDNLITARLEMTPIRIVQKTFLWRGFRRFEKRQLMRKIHVPWEVEAWIKKQSSKTKYAGIRYVVVYNIPHIYQTAFSSSQFLSMQDINAYFNNKLEPLPVFYNQTVRQHLNENVWFVFCHQDFVIKEDLREKLKGKDTETIYGPIGGRIGTSTLVGAITQTDGTEIGSRLEGDTPVQTLDEMCLLAHSNVFRKGLWFDEQFALHFYGADFCLQAYKLGFDVKALPLKCQHRSRTIRGDQNSREYLFSREHFRRKWVNFLPIRTTTTTLEPGQHDR